MEDLERLTVAELLRLRAYWHGQLPSARVAARLDLIEQEIVRRQDDRGPGRDAPQPWLMIPASLVEDIELACYAARLRWSPQTGEIHSAEWTCLLETTESGGLLATLTRDRSRPRRRTFARRFDPEHAWTESGGAQGDAPIPIYDDCSLARELVSWVAREQPPRPSH